MYYEDYFWKAGMPYGLRKVSSSEAIPSAYKIVMDPYRKRISIEEYAMEKFSRVIYDSVLLDFRKLNPMEQVAWNKELVTERNDFSECLIRDQNERVVWKEKYYFQDNYCRECKIYSPQDLFLARQQMLYKSLGDKQNGLILYDIIDHPIMFKSYEVDEDSRLFTNVIMEEWDGTLIKGS